MEILRDPLWQFVGIILTLIAIFVSILVYLKQRNRKELSYEIISRTSLLSREEEIGGALQVQYNGQPVKKVQLVEINFENTGNTPILVNEYERPISLDFGETSKVLTAEISKKFPENLSASLSIKDKNVIIDPLLLNSKESLTLKMLISNGSKVSIDCRIVGISSIKEATESRNFLIPMFIGSGIMVGGILLSAVNPNDYVALFIATVGMILMYAGIFTRSRFRKNLKKSNLYKIIFQR